MPFYKDIRFSEAELARYNRHIILPQFGLEAQQKLKAAKVLVVGSGGLGSPLLLYLAAAGVARRTGRFRCADVTATRNAATTNVGDTGNGVTYKRQPESTRNPHRGPDSPYPTSTAQNALDILRDYDVVADGTDNFPTHTS